VAVCQTGFLLALGPLEKRAPSTVGCSLKHTLHRGRSCSAVCFALDTVRQHLGFPRTRWNFFPRKELGQGAVVPGSLVEAEDQVVVAHVKEVVPKVAYVDCLCRPEVEG
jgi:hypothetical protein